jgi:hypothetical protein
MQDRITRELNYLRYKMLLKVTDNRLLSPAQKELVMSMLRTTSEDIEKERGNWFGFQTKKKVE